MRNNFRTYQLAVDFYRDLQNVQLPCHLKDQLNRAGASIPLNSNCYPHLLDFELFNSLLKLVFWVKRQDGNNYECTWMVL